MEEATTKANREVQGRGFVKCLECPSSLQRVIADTVEETHDLQGICMLREGSRLLPCPLLSVKLMIYRLACCKQLLQYARQPRLQQPWRLFLFFETFLQRLLSDAHSPMLLCHAGSCCKIPKSMLSKHPPWLHLLCISYPSKAYPQLSL